MFQLKRKASNAIPPVLLITNGVNVSLVVLTFLFVFVLMVHLFDVLSAV